MRAIHARLCATVVLMCVFGAVFAADPYPNRPIRFLVGNPPGGGQDILARAIGAKLTDSLGVSVVVDNRAGASGNIAAELVARAAPDGHTLLMIGFANATNVSLFKSLPFDLLRDFAGIALAGESTNLFVVPGNSRVATVKDLIAQAQSNPGKLNYGSGGNGTMPHLGTELFKRMANVEIVHVPFKGGGQSMISAISGQVDMLLMNPLSGLPHVKAGRLKALAVTSLKRSPALPDVPTVAESGLRGFEVISWWGVSAPAKTPKAIVGKLNAAIGEALKQPDIVARFDSQGIAPGGGSPEQFGSFLKSEVEKWSKIIAAAGIKPI